VKGLSFGLGLGLPIVLKIIKSYSGSINVESSSKGTIFTIKIPVGGKYAN
jgi:signal transduction histidine kinase